MECRRSVEAQSRINRLHYRSAHVNDGAGVTLTANPNYEEIEGIVQGAGRLFADADRLNLIDFHMLPLARGMNSLAGVETIACCQGHGFFGRYSQPYVLFTAPKSVAWAFQMTLENDFLSNRPKLKYWWDMEARFNAKGESVYRLSAPSLNRYLWITRKQLDADFEAVLRIFQEVHRSK